MLKGSTTFILHLKHNSERSIHSKGMNSEMTLTTKHIALWSYVFLQLSSWLKHLCLTLSVAMATSLACSSPSRCPKSSKTSRRLFSSRYLEA